MWVALATTGMDGRETSEGFVRILRRVANETMTAALGITNLHDQGTY